MPEQAGLVAHHGNDHVGRTGRGDCLGETAPVGGGDVAAARVADVGQFLADKPETKLIPFVLVGGGNIAVVSSNNTDVINKDTEAYIGPSAVVNAMAQNTTGMTVFQNGVGSDGSFSTTTANGVAVQAESSEGVFTIAASSA